MQKATTQLRALLRGKTFLHMPAVYDAIGARLAESTGFEAAYVGGYVTGSRLAVSEPQLTMTEQVAVAGEAAQSVAIPIVADGGAGYGEPLHSMRTVREFVRAGIAGIHIEDQLFPKRAHYHTYVVHAIPVQEFVDKIRYACKQRDESDKDFVIIARSDTARELGIEEATMRVNRAAEAGADYGLIFPRTPAEAERAPKLSDVPLFYVQSRGNRDGRPIISRKDLESMGYVACIEAQVVLCSAFHFMKKMMTELRETGNYTGISEADFVASRQAVEDLIGLDEYYKIEEDTVEAAYSKK